MKICIIGGAGDMALGSLRDFLEQDEVENIVLADIDYGRLERLRDTLASPKVSIVAADASSAESVCAALEGADVCLNATFPRFNIGIMKQCLKVGVHYTDYGGLYHATKEQLLLDGEFRAAGLTAVVGSGAGPGLTQILAAAAAEGLDEVTTVRLYAGISPGTPTVADGCSFRPPYSLETIVDEFSVNPWQFIEGQQVELEPFTGAEEVTFPEPIGTMTAYHTIHSEPWTIAKNWGARGVRNVLWRLALPTDFVEKLRFLVELGLTSKKSITVDGASVAPLHLLLALVASCRDAAGGGESTVGHVCERAVVSGMKNGRQVERVCEFVSHDYPKWDMACGAFITGFSAAIACRMLGNGMITERGANSSEALVPWREFFALLAERGVEARIL